MFLQIPDTTTTTEKPKPEELLSELPKIVENTIKVPKKKKRKRKKKKNSRKRKRKPLKKRRKLFFKRQGFYAPYTNSYTLPTRHRRLRPRRPVNFRKRFRVVPNNHRNSRPMIPKAILKKRQDGASYLKNLNSSFDVNRQVSS